MSSQDHSTEPGSAAANQRTTEPMPPTQGHADPDAAPAPVSVERPDLETMNVGAGDPQAPSHPAAGPPGDPAHAGFSSTETPVAPDPERAAQGSTGMAFRAPGSVGVEGDDEQLETDADLSAARTSVTGTPGTASGPGDAAGVPVGSEQSSPGTSQESSVAQGSRTPL